MATITHEPDTRTRLGRIIVTVKGESVPVHTWADGFGRWHAEFQASENIRRDVTIAREAIAFEIACREGASAANHLSVVRMYRRADLPYHRHYAERV